MKLQQNLHSSILQREKKNYCLFQLILPKGDKIKANRRVGYLQLKTINLQQSSANLLYTDDITIVSQSRLPVKLTFGHFLFGLSVIFSRISYLFSNKFSSFFCFFLFVFCFVFVFFFGVYISVIAMANMLSIKKSSFLYFVNFKDT